MLVYGISLILIGLAYIAAIHVMNRENKRLKEINSTLLDISKNTCKLLDNANEMYKKMNGINETTLIILDKHLEYMKKQLETTLEDRNNDYDGNTDNT